MASKLTASGRDFARLGSWISILLVFLSLSVAGSVRGDDDLLAGPMKKVEELRGRRFLRPVEHRTITRKELRDYLRNQITRDLPVPPERYFAILRALHLIEKPVSVDDILDLYDAQVLAFYDPRAHIFYSLDQPPAAFKDSLPEAMQSAIVIHELTHALQDQLFDIGSRVEALHDDWDGEMAMQSVMEGEATLVMLAYLADSMGVGLGTLVADDTVLTAMSSASNAAAGFPADTPEYFVESMKFPYLQGLRFVTAAYRRGGWKSVDDIDRCVPATSEQILDPGLYWTASDNGGGAAGKRSDLTTTLGAFHWNFLLGADAATGWRGDQVTIQHEGEAEGVLVVTSWDTAADAKRFASAYEKFLKSKGETPQLRVDRTNVRIAYRVTEKTANSFLRGKTSFTAASKNCAAAK